MISMTGFGKAESSNKTGRFTVEVSTVNNRYLEISPRIPRQFFALEGRIRELISAQLNRGKVQLYVGFDEAEEAPGRYVLNQAAARAYCKQLRKLKKDLGLNGDIELRELLLLPDVTNPEKERIDTDLIWKALEKTITAALNELVRMRKREGEAMAKDMRGRLKEIARLNSRITKAAPRISREHREKVRARIVDLLDSRVVDEGRVEEELAILADKTDITEECTRFKSHVDEYRRALKLTVPVGKRLNFILQEMNREANTMASKCANSDIATDVISLKEEIEKLREQAQNVE